MNELFLGVSKKDITPYVGCRLFGYQNDIYSTSVHDNLDATAFVFRQGSSTAALISITLVCLTEGISDNIRNLISEKTGIPFENITLSCTHTHSGPATFCMARKVDDGWGDDMEDEYIETVLVPHTVAAAVEAQKNAVPVEMGYETGESYIGINRRELTAENKIILGQNPWGPYNPRMTVISFRTLDGKPYANMIHFGMHGTCSGHNTEITQDWAGVMVRRMEALTGAVSAFFNGPEGDIGPRLTNGRTTGICEVKYAEETGGRAAFDAMAVYNKIKRFYTPALTVHSGVLRIPLEKRLPLDEAERRHDALVKKEGKIAAERAMVATYRDLIESYSTGYVDKEYTEVPQTVIKLDNVAFLNYPYELFSEIGMRVQKEFADMEILPMSLCNGAIGYFPTEDQFVRGGYEVVMFNTLLIQEHVHNADWHLFTESVRNIKETK